MSTEQHLQEGFEAAMFTLYPNEDVLRFKDNTYRNHSTHNLFMLYCYGLADGRMEYFEQPKGELK